MEQFLAQLKATHKDVVNYVGMKSTETRNLAANYSLANKTYSGVALDRWLEEMNELIVKENLTEITFTENQSSFYFASIMFLNGYSPAIVQTNADAFNQLIKAGFSKSHYTFLAALYIEDEQHATRAYAMYRAMKKHHILLTGSEDVVMSVFITKNKELHIEEVADVMKRYYDELKQVFTKGDHLQLLSQVLVIWSPHYTEHLTPYVKQLKEEFKKRKINISKKQYVQLGILALHKADSHTIEEINNLYTILCNDSLFKNKKSSALQIAIRKILQDNEAQSSVVDQQALMYLEEMAQLSDHLMNLAIKVVQGVSIIVTK